MNDFDDRELGDALRRRAGAATDGYGLEAIRSNVVARAGRIRRRRVAIAGGAAMTGLIASVAFVIGPGTDSVVTTPAEQTVGSVPASIDRSLPTTSAATEPDRTGPDDSTADTTPTITALPNPTTLPAVVPSTVPSTVTAPPITAPVEPGSTVGTPATDPPTTTSPPTTAPPGPDLPSTETYSSAGGSITVRWDGVALSLQQLVPGTGFTYEVEDERADRIRVRFEGDGGDFRIEIRVEDGEVVRVE